MAATPGMLEATAAIIADYREGEVARPDAAHVQRWLDQFDENVRESLLAEMNHVLTHTYLSKKTFETFLSNLVVNQDLTAGDPKKFWSGVKFLDIQSRGRSQHELLAMLVGPLKKETGLDPAQCGASPSCFVYLDDGLYSGNTILNSLRVWLRNSAPNDAIVHVVVVTLHRYGQYWASTSLKKDAAAVGKKVEFKWWRLIELEDRRMYTNESDVLRPTKIPDDALTKAYADSLKYKPVLRTPGNVGALKIFSGEAGRDLLEQQFLVKGASIRENSKQLPEFARPLGNVVLEMLGFGSTITEDVFYARLKSSDLKFEGPIPLDILVHLYRIWVKVLLVIVALGICVYAINQFRSITGGEPSRAAANLLLFWTAAVFAPIGFLIELAGLKVADK